MELQVYNINGQPSGRKIRVSKAVFGAEPNEHAVYLAVQSQRTNGRQGTAATRTRSMVSGGGRKPWRQKGRGTSRAGTTRSPIWRGGGVTHGPQPHPHSYRLPRKVKQLARISVLSQKHRDKQLKVLENFSIEQARTREVAAILRDFELTGRKALLLVSEYDGKILRASRNIKSLKVSIAADASTYDLLDCQALLVTESAIKKLEGMLKP